MPGRFQVVSGAKDDITVVVDYAHTDDALRNLLETARPLANGRLITVFGCGGDRDRTKRPLMGAVAGRLSDLIVVTSDNPRSEDPARIIEEIQRGITADTRRDAAQRLLTVPDRHEAIDTAIELARPGDLVLIAGKGHEKYQVIGSKVLPFDDVSVARDALGRKRSNSGVVLASMLYHLLYPFHTQLSVLNVVQYITFRTAAASLSAFVISLTLGPWLIRKLREFQIGQVIRQEGPTSHRAKAGTPTMGGLLILTAALGPTLLWAKLDNAYVWIAVLTTALFGAIGFFDDYLKIVRRDHHGLRPRYKMGWQIAVATAVGAVLLVLAQNGVYNTRLIFPFFKRLIPELGIWYLPFAVFVLVAVSNAVNLTDGLDGLAISTFSIAAAAYTALTYVTGNRVLADYLLLVQVSAIRRADDLLRGARRRVARISLVQLVPGRDFHGRRRIAGARRRARNGGDSHQAGTAVRDRGRRLRHRGVVGRDPGGGVQVDRQARVQDGADSPSLRVDRLERAEGDRAIRDRRDPVRAL